MGVIEPAGKHLADSIGMSGKLVISCITTALATACVHHPGDGDAPPDFTDGVSTLAGTAQPGYIDGARADARFRNPTGIAVGPDHRIYVADFENNKIRRIEADGTTSTVIAQVGFARPFALAFKGAQLYITTDSNNTGAHAPMKTGSVWSTDVSSGAAVEIVDSIGMPRGITPLADGRFAVADYENHVVELVSTNGEHAVLAGAFGQPGYADGVGSAARFSMPYGIVQRPDGTLIVADHDNNRLRVVTLDGNVTTFAGTGQAGFADGTMTGAMFNHPQALAIDSAGKIYVTDSDNYRVRRISGTTIDTIAGDGMGGYLDDDNSLASELYGLEGVAVAPDGSMVYVADGTRGDDVPFNRVRQIKMK